MSETLMMFMCNIQGTSYLKCFSQSSLLLSQKWAMRRHIVHMKRQLACNLPSCLKIVQLHVQEGQAQTSSLKRSYEAGTATKGLDLQQDNCQVISSALTLCMLHNSICHGLYGTI